MTGQITELLDAAVSGDRGAREELFRITYDQLKLIAHRQLRRRPGHETLRTTALVHETFLKLLAGERAAPKDRTHFFALASRAMRQILVDYFRRRRADKRGGDALPVEWSVEEIPVEQRGGVLLALDEALERLAELDARLVRVVECRFFGGMTQEETAEALGVSDRTVRADWAKAKAFLARELSS